MFLDIIYTGLLISCCSFSIVQNAEVEKTTTDPVFGDIMRNITRVNSLLQDLIKNYEQLKKMSQPDSIESNYSEEEEVFRSKSKYTTSARTHKLFATAMIISDTETESKSDNSQETKINKDIDETKKEKQSEKEKRDKRKQPVNKASRSKKKKQHFRKGKHDKKEEKKVEAEKPKDTALETNDDSKQNGKQQDLIPTIEALRKLVKAFSEETDFDEESNNKSDSTPTRTTLGSMATRVPKVIMLGSKTTHAPKTKEHLKSTVENYEFPKIEITSRQGTHIARALEQGEGQQRNIALYLERKKQLNQKNSPQKTLIIIPRNKKKSEAGVELSELDSDSAEGKVQKEELKAVMLRQAYGDACLRLVLRKCTMACKAVYKEVCQGSKKCSPTYKRIFKKSAISGCNTQFGNSTSLSFRGVDNEPSVTGDGFVDLTREGYLSMACSPSTFKNDVKLKPIIRGTNPSTKSETGVNPLNILRDKYEAACQRTSISKCIKACRYASKEACNAEKCGGKKKRALDKSCKRRCKQSYGRGYSGEDDSDDETSSDSEKSKSREEKEDKW